MSIDEVVLLLKASQANGLTTLQETVLRSSWEGKTYTTIAVEAHYGEERVRKVASNLWQLLSNFWREPINKFNFRSSLEPRSLSKMHQQLIQEFNRAATAISLEFPSGPVSLDSRFYISRPPVEELAYTQIGEPGSVIYIKAAQKMGKSSLILRLLEHAVNQGFHTVSLDFQQADKAVFASLDKFLRWLCANISRELQLEPKLNDYWDEEMGSKVSCSIYFQSYLLPALTSPLVLVFNEVDWVFEYSEIAGEFLPLVRFWHEQARRVEIWEKLRLVLVFSAEIIVPLKLTQSPFNIGLPIKLPPFTTEQVQELAQRHGLDWTDGKEASSLMAMVGGHPYLVRLALYHLVGKGGLERDLNQLLQHAATTAGIYHEYLSQYLLALREEPELADAFYQVITATDYVKLDPVVAYKLQRMGLVNVEGTRCTPACELYRLYFRDQLNTIKDARNIRFEELEKENQQLRDLYRFDELTQLANHRYFHNYLQVEWQRLTSKNATHRPLSEKGNCEVIYDPTPLSLILCDIDYFKIYNKIYGNHAGDNCLRQIANTIVNAVKQPFGYHSFSFVNSLTYQAHHHFETSHTGNSQMKFSSVLVTRYGGEEFAILTQTDATAAVYIAEHIRSSVKALEIPCEYPGIDGLPATVLTVSLGVASMIPNAENEPNTLVNAAEQALYQAKRKGRDRVILI
ncbi:AAA-like domain-containing protein [Nostoc sp. CENA67]|uniref:AAA-like domain-containing protein n=1 Tax=Amazonocrinis nigriterrae CENA67 TaxID=2794033 RepID=A0A8J7HWV7_9NOST|nr:AAA-like domain-containing protein [Amazonocrinis nigriterrae]MBH8564782.1 AAA-like domain-containing protein [Amazonocrinis nigriterrae CENA67]